MNKRSNRIFDSQKEVLRKKYENRNNERRNHCRAYTSFEKMRSLFRYNIEKKAKTRKTLNNYNFSFNYFCLTMPINFIFFVSRISLDASNELRGKTFSHLENFPFLIAEYFFHNLTKILFHISYHFNTFRNVLFFCFISVSEYRSLPVV